MKIQKPVYYFKERFLKGGLSKQRISETMDRFKKELDYSELMMALPEIMKIDTRFKQLIWGNLFPKDYTQLGVGNNYYYRSEGVIFEMNWLLVQIAKNKKKLGEFVKDRDSVYKHIALGAFDRAEYEVIEIEKKYGISVWTTEMRLTIYSLAEKEKQSFELLEKVNKARDEVTVKGKNGYVPLLAHFLFKRASSQSASSYEEELNAINKRNRNDFQIDRHKYYQFRLNYYAANDRTNLDSLLIYETANSLVDKYLSLINLIKWMFASSETERLIALEYATKLYGYVPDESLFPLLAYLLSDRLPDTYYDKEYIKIIDAYYCGKYRETVNLCKRFLRDNPNHFDCVLIYVQSLVFLNYSFSPIVNEQKSVTNQVAYLIYQSLNEPDNTTSLADLADYNKRIYGLPIAAGAHNYISEQRKNKTDYYQKALVLPSFSPLYALIWKDGEKDCAIKYYENAQKKGIKSVVIDYYLSKLKGDNNVYSEGIATYIVEEDLAKAEYTLQHYDNCISKFKSIFYNWGQYLLIGQMACEYIFESYVESGAKMDAISFFVDRYIQKKSLVNKIQTGSFMETLRRERYKKDVKNTIDLQIFVFLNAAEEEQKAHALQMYMNYLDAGTISELIDAIKNDIPQEKQEIFLFALVEGDILRHLLYIGSTKQMLEEQQIIVQYLTQLNSSNHELYEEYNKQILETMIIYENIRKLDESRIYVNEAAIIKYELRECENLYRQLATRNEIAKEVTSVYVLQTSEDGFKEDVDVRIMQTGFKTTHNVTTDISTQIFNLICQKYLFSKFGLKTYLSTRIRHGVLEGEIRSVFDSLHLMLTTQDNRFTPITYWRITYNLSPVEQDLLMQKLAFFSAQLGQIIDSFKSEVVQIKTKQEDPGMFDYVLPDEKKSYAVNLAQNKTDNYDDFCASILLFLDQVTEQSLVKIREYIHNTLQDKFIQLIGKLESEVECFTMSHFYPALKQVISLSRENIQGCLVKIEKWFSLQTGVYDDFNLKNQIELVWNVTERQYPNIKYNLTPDIDDANCILDASHYLDIADMLTIIYNNMFGHSKVENTRQFVISAKRIEDDLILHFENLTNEDDEVLNKMFETLLKSDNRYQLEGRSGLAKVMKIVRYDLLGSDDDFSVVAENGVCKVDVKINLNGLRKNKEEEKYE